MLRNFPGLRQTRVLVIDDSAFMRTALTRMIESDRTLKVIGTAANGIEALEKISALRPDVVTLDIEMPGLDGLSVLRRVMESDPVPVVIVSSLSKRGAEATIQAFELGAFECIPKEQSHASLDIVRIRDFLVDALKAAACSKVEKISPRPAAERAPAPFCGPEPLMLAIGSSTGGPKALQEILPALPASLPIPVLVTQHMPAGFTAPFAHRLNSLCKLRVKEAEADEPLLPGWIYIAPATWHMTVYRRSLSKYFVRLSKQPEGVLHRPSVDVTMLSVAEVFRNQALGVILTGMGCDGMRGMKAIFDEGGWTIGQDAASSSVYGMPRACAELGVLKRVLPSKRIAEGIVSVVNFQPQPETARLALAAAAAQYR